MSDFDRFKLVSTTLIGGLFTALRASDSFHGLATAAMAVLAIIGVRTWYAASCSSLKEKMLLIFICFSNRGGVRKQQYKYAAKHQQLLYYSHIASNRGALSLLLDRACEEEQKVVVVRAILF